MSITITEIAQHCGRSVSTVSNVLRNGKNARRYSDSTRQEIMQAAETLGYRPNFFASQLQRQNRRLVMLTYGSLIDTFASSIANAFGQAVTARGYATLTAPLNQSQEHGLLDAAVGPQGILALAVIGDSSAEILPDADLLALSKRGVTVVAIGRRVEGAQVAQVLYDDEGGVRDSVEHLLAGGGKHFWLVGTRSGSRRPSILERRLNQAREILTARGIRGIHEPDLSAVPQDNATWQPHQAYHAAHASLAAGHRPDTVFCASDHCATGTMKALREVGLQPGRDVAVIGYNETGINEFLEPPLSSVHIPVADLGRLAANQLLDCYEGLGEPGAVITLQTRLIIRESSKLDNSNK